MSEGNGDNRVPVEVFETYFPSLAEESLGAPRRRPLWPALLLFLLTVISTLAVGAEFAQSYAQSREPFSGDQDMLTMMALPFHHPSLLALGIPFSFTLLTILFAHEMGHYVAAKLYRIDVSYPYFIPAPNLFGTFGAFIRIRSPIATRRALFDVGLSGPVAGFLLAAPAMAFGVATSKIVPGVEDHADLVFGHPLLVRILAALFHPHIQVNWLLLSPVGRAAWVGLFVTALNLLPAWQLDGGHVMYAFAGRRHQKISLSVALGLLLMGWLTSRHSAYQFSLWYAWGILLTVLTLRFRHPPVYDAWQPLDGARRTWGAIAVGIFALCFTPWPVQ